MRLLFLALTACNHAGSTVDVDTTAEAPALAECAVCGMVVREQPAPRGQVVLRDGQHLHFCSVGDLRAWLAAPSALGTPIATHVEVLPPDQDPLQVSTEPHPWVPADDAWFVFGAARPRIMGAPALTFREEAVARRHAAALDAEPVDWSTVRNTPFHVTPGVSEKP